MLKLLTGELQPDNGTVTLAKTLSGIVIDQQRKLMEPNKRVKDVLANGGDWIEVRGSKKHIKGYLKEFLFDPAIADAPIGSLSGGERSRLLLAREFAREANLLVLDEPTNDLDLETLDLLQEVIADYDGTVLIVSHDRDFLDRTVTITLGLDGSGKVDIVAGGYEDWVRQAVRSAPQLPGEGRGRARRSAERGRLPTPTSRKRGGRSSPTRTSATTIACRTKSSGSRQRSGLTKKRFRTPTSTRATPSASPSSPSASPAIGPTSRRLSIAGWKLPRWRSNSHSQ